MQRRILILFLLALLYNPSYGQNSILDTLVSLPNGEYSLIEIVENIESSTSIRFSYDSDLIDSEQSIRLGVAKLSIRDIILIYFQKSNAGIMVREEHIIIHKNLLTSQPSGDLEKGTLHGFVRESGSDEFLPGATVYVPELGTGISTNAYGFYSLTIPKGDYFIQYSYLGHEQKNDLVSLYKDTEHNIDISLTSNELDEIVIRASESGPEGIGELSGHKQLQISEIKDTPALLSEPDVLKTLQMLPGVKFGLEGTANMHVRGGGPGQNLIMLDDAIVYNSNHAFGLFSLFNSDIIKSVDLYKGAFPAQYGGRLSSVLNMTMREGNKHEHSGTVSASLISTSGTIEGPINKGRSSFIVSGRISHLGELINLFINDPEHDESNLSFFDLNAKVNFKLSEVDQLYLSGYVGNDGMIEKRTNLLFDRSHTDKWSWGNLTYTARWNRLISKKIFSNAVFNISEYTFNVTSDESSENGDFEVEYETGVRDIALKYELDIHLNTKHNLKVGVHSIAHRFLIKDVDSFFNGSRDSRSTRRVRNGIENFLYFSDNIKLSNRWTVLSGLRLSHFSSDGNTYFNPELRLNSSYQMNNKVHLNFAYSDMRQYLHLLSNSGIGLPTDLWIPAGKNLTPEQSRQVSLGLSFTHNSSQISLDTYYKNMNGIINYRPNSSFVEFRRPESALDFDIENNAISGAGKAYGLESLFKHQFRRSDLQLAYTLSWTRQRFDELNDNDYFFPRFDTRHDMFVNFTHKPHRRFIMSVSFVYTSSQSFTIPNLSYVSYKPDLHMDGPSGYQSEFTEDAFVELGNFRGRAYHRMDISFKWPKITRWGRRTWELAIYNLYNRKNAFHYDIDSELINGQYRNIVKRVGVFPIVPSLKFRYEF